MTQRYTRVIGRSRVREATYPYIFPADSPRVRAEKSRSTRSAQRALNLDNSAVKLELMLDINFSPDDLFVTLTYRPDCLPQTRKDVIKSVGQFFDVLRKARRLKGDVLKYIYCVEHGKDRWHIHAVINAVGRDYEQIRSLWNRWGNNVDFKSVGEKSIDGIAHYMVKETDRPNSARAWIPSRNLDRPVYESYTVKRPVTLQTPDGCKEIAAEAKRNEWSGYAFIKYDVPEGVNAAEFSGIGDLTGPDIELRSRRLL